ncbi:MAG TPA: hypothetical protein PKC43_12935, partial [Phycisphaerales bacterium]|nr:hypothetical protein [Phycisphaerales bacterium]
MYSTNGLCCTRGIGIAVSALALASAATIAAADGVLVTYTFNGQPEQTLELDYIGPHFSGGFQYRTVLVLDGVPVTWDYVIRIAANGVHSLNGFTRVDNQSPEIVTLQSRSEWTFCPPLVSDVFMGGNHVVALNTFLGGGCLTAGDGPAVSIAATDSIAVNTAFWSPFNLCFGAGQGSTSAPWGTPIPSFPYPPGALPVRALAHEVSIGLTDGDLVTVNGLVAANGVKGDPAADADGDGVADCIDGCPDDPKKTEPGDCGCGVSDV